MSLQAPESSFDGIRVADRVWETVPGGRTSGGESSADICAESVTWYVQ